MRNNSSHSIHWLSVGLAYSTLFLLGLADNLRGPLYPDVLKDLQLSDSQGSLLWATASALGFLGAVVTPTVVGRSGLLGTLKWALGLMVLGQAGMAMSPGLAWALLSCVSFGISLGLLGVVQNILVLQAGPAQAIQRLQAGLHSNYAGASLLAPLLLSGLALFAPGWRTGYGAGALLSFFGWASLWFVAPASVEDHHEAHANAQSGGAFHKWKAAWVGSVLAFYVVMEIMVSSRLALFLRREAQFDFQQASLATTVFFVGLFAGRILFVFWQPPLSLKKQMIISLFATLVLMLLGLGVDPRCMILTGLSMSPFFPLIMSYIGEKFPKHLSAATAMAISLDGFFVVLMHAGVGLLTQSLGIVQALYVGPLVAVLGLLALIFDNWILDDKN
jgi:fucose permease